MWNNKKKGNRIVLFLDEFDYLLDEKALVSIQKRERLLAEGPTVDKVETPLDSLLNTLRGVKSQRMQMLKDEKVVQPLYVLQSCVIVGQLSILQAANTRLSPFNSSDTMQAPYFSLEDTAQLFKQFQDKTGKKLEDGIVEDIF